MKDKRKIRILVIEDKPEEMTRAREMLDLEKEEIDAFYARDFEEACHFLGIYLEAFDPRGPLGKARVDAVLSDIFFPLEAGSKTYGREEPIGVAVMWICQRQSIPCILVTDSDHHNSRLQWITTFSRALGLPEMVDSFGDPKEWGKAIEFIKKALSS